MLICIISGYQRKRW